MPGAASFCWTHWLSGWPKTNPNSTFTTKMVFPKSLKFMNSGSEWRQALRGGYKVQEIEGMTWNKRESSLEASIGIAFGVPCSSAPWFLMRLCFLEAFWVGFAEKPKENHHFGGSHLKRDRPMCQSRGTPKMIGSPLGFPFNPPKKGTLKETHIDSHAGRVWMAFICLSPLEQMRANLSSGRFPTKTQRK